MANQAPCFLLNASALVLLVAIAKIPAQENVSIRLKSFVSDSQYVRMEPNISMVPGTKFGVSLDVELDGVFNADESFQLGSGAASNDKQS